MEGDSLSKAPWENGREPFSVSSKKITKDAYFLLDSIHFWAAVEAGMSSHQTQEAWPFFGGIFLCQCLPHFPFTPTSLWCLSVRSSLFWTFSSLLLFLWSFAAERLSESIPCPSGPCSALLLLPRAVAQPQPPGSAQAGVDVCPSPIQAWSLAAVASKPCPSLSWAAASWPWLTPCWEYHKQWEQPHTDVQALQISPHGLRVLCVAGALASQGKALSVPLHITVHPVPTARRCFFLPGL